jgi:hypothetical protein
MVGNEKPREGTPMIHTEAGLRATRESLTHLENALLGLTRSRSEYHPKTFELLAAPIRDEILARRAEIDEYIGLAATESDHPPGEIEAKPTTNGPDVEKEAGVFSG